MQGRFAESAAQEVACKNYISLYLGYLLRRNVFIETVNT
jgi:hypothetical protein